MQRLAEAGAASASATVAGHLTGDAHLLVHRQKGSLIAAIR